MVFIYFSFHIQSESKTFKLQLDANLNLQDIFYVFFTPGYYLSSTWGQGTKKKKKKSSSNGVNNQQVTVT